MSTYRYIGKGLYVYMHTDTLVGAHYHLPIPIPVHAHVCPLHLPSLGILVSKVMSALCSHSHCQVFPMSGTTHPPLPNMGMSIHNYTCTL